MLDEGDIIIDGGNSHFPTPFVASTPWLKGLHFVGVGVSGGEEGALWGPSMMPGGSAEVLQAPGPAARKIAAKAPQDGAPCCAWISTDGAGHFVKMVHNGIEYADMQVIGEAYDILRSIAGIEPAQQAEIFKTWNEGNLSSYLIEITAEVLAQVDARPASPWLTLSLTQRARRVPACGPLTLAWTSVPPSPLSQSPCSHAPSPPRA